MTAVVLWVVVVAALVLAIVVFVRPVPSSTVSAPAAMEQPRWDVAGFAELFVTTYVAAGDGVEQSLAPFLGSGQLAALTGTVPGDWFPSSATVTALSETGPDRWRVTAAVGLLRRDDTNGYVSLGVRFFEVDVVATGDVLTATGLPSIAPAPPSGDGARDSWGNGAVPDDNDSLADSVERFLAALLTGNGELARYAAPGSGLVAAAATFDTVTLERLSVRDAGAAREVRAWVRGESNGVRLWLSYDLRVEERAGRWEVVAMGPEPFAKVVPEVPVTSTAVIVVGDSTQGS